MFDIKVRKTSMNTTLKKINIPIYKLLLFVLLTFLLVLFWHFIKQEDNEFYQNCNPKQYICGNIDVIMESRILQSLAGAPKNITIISGGGNHIVAMRIAEALNENNITLIIDGPCFSACAQDLVLAVHKVIVTNNGIIAFHTSGSYMHKIASHFFPDHTKYLNHTRSIMLEEESFFKKNQLDKNALYVPGEIMEIGCIGKEIIITNVDMFLYRQSKYMWYVPSISVIEKWRGGHILLGKPTTSDDFAKRLSQYPILLSKSSFVYKSTSEIDDLEASINRIQFCER
jgi:hypothetical protein